MSYRHMSDLIPLIPKHRVDVCVTAMSEVVDYNHSLMGIPQIWKSTKGTGIKIAVLDSGRPKHIDLAPSGGLSFIPGYDFDQNGHATHCAGIIGALAGNGIGVQGIAPEADDYYGAVLNGDGSGTVDAVVRGVYWAVDGIGANIISMSLGFPSAFARVAELEKACDYARSRGVTIFAAAGNEGGPVSQPACYDSVCAIAAVNSRKQVAPFSNRGKEVMFAAGGVDVYSTYLNNTYAKLSGTSMACPALAAVAALIMSDALNGANPRLLTPDALITKLKGIATVPTGDTATEVGYGIPFFKAEASNTIVVTESWLKRMIRAIYNLFGAHQ